MKNTIEKQHAAMVLKLVKPGKEIIEELTTNKAHALHMAVGISGESGELLDAIKKYVIYNKELDRENIIEELGDIDFYLEGLRQGLGISRKETLQANIEKLTKRYKGLKYSNESAQARADKLPEELENRVPTWVLQRIRMDDVKEYVHRLRGSDRLELSSHLEDAINFLTEEDCIAVMDTWNKSINKFQFGIELLAKKMYLT